MPSPSWENLDEFLQLDTTGDFAAAVVLHFRSGDTRTIRAIFDDPYLNAQLGEYDADTSAPRLTCKEIDVLGLDRGDAVTIAGQEYAVLTRPQSDGTGMAIVRMALHV